MLWRLVVAVVMTMMVIVIVRLITGEKANR